MDYIQIHENSKKTQITAGAGANGMNLTASYARTFGYVKFPL